MVYSRTMNKKIFFCLENRHKEWSSPRFIFKLLRKESFEKDNQEIVLETILKEISGANGVCKDATSFWLSWTF